MSDWKSWWSYWMILTDCRDYISWDLLFLSLLDAFCHFIDPLLLPHEVLILLRCSLWPLRQTICFIVSASSILDVKSEGWQVHQPPVSCGVKFSSGQDIGEQIIICQDSEICAVMFLKYSNSSGKDGGLVFLCSSWRPVVKLWSQHPQQNCRRQ